MAYGTAVNTRVANALGAGKAAAAGLSFRITTVIVTTQQCCFATALWIFRRQVAHFFTDDEDVIDMVESLVPVLCAAMLGDGEACLRSNTDPFIPP